MAVVPRLGKRLGRRFRNAEVDNLRNRAPVKQRDQNTAAERPPLDQRIHNGFATTSVNATLLFVTRYFAVMNPGCAYHMNFLNL